jgi:hypothetical protein
LDDGVFGFQFAFLSPRDQFNFTKEEEKGREERKIDEFSLD